MSQGSCNKARVELMKKRRSQKNPHIKQCAFCGDTDNLEEHHMIPMFLGGTNDDRNLIFLCHKCHRQVSVYQRKFIADKVEGE